MERCLHIVAIVASSVYSFLDKLYCLSSQEAMETFLRNPRPFLLPPQPRIPCRLSVLGPPLSGTSTLCHLLAHKYGAKVGRSANADCFHRCRHANMELKCYL